MKGKWGGRSGEKLKQCSEVQEQCRCSSSSSSRSNRRQERRQQGVEGMNCFVIGKIGG